VPEFIFYIYSENYLNRDEIGYPQCKKFRQICSIREQLFEGKSLSSRSLAIDGLTRLVDSRRCFSFAQIANGFNDEISWTSVEIDIRLIDRIGAAMGMIA
jgi:hypothetical protein